jgi:putative hydrolase of the HAD superfamily
MGRDRNERWIDSMTSTFIFDLGKVLVDFDMNQMDHKIGKVCGLTGDESRAILTKDNIQWRYECGELSTEDVFKIFKSHGKREFELSDLAEAGGSIFTEKLEMQAVLKEIKNRGHRLALLSNTCPIHIDWIAKHFQVLEFFDDLFYSFELKSMKPDKDIYLKAIKALGVEASDCFFTDDLQDNVKAAKELGMNAVVFKELDSLVAYLEPIW